MPGNPFYQSPFWRSLRTDALKRDRYRCTVPGCMERGTHVDHIRTRPRGATIPTEADTLSNLRTLCASHDAQLKEQANGERRNGGRARVVGCDAEGWPLDPARGARQPRG